MSTPNIWFTADTHWGHKAIVEYCKRPWATCDDMNRALVSNWNAVVKSNDDVYHLGDFALRLRPADLLHIRRRLNGRIHLVEGNHDVRNMKAEVRASFEWVKQLADIKIDGRHVVLCHFPLLTWNRRHHGAWHCHGHAHGNLGRPEPGVLRMDVGVDCHPEYRPFSWDEVKTYMAEQQ